jgi:hypothetical protein
MNERQALRFSFISKIPRMETTAPPINTTTGKNAPKSKCHATNDEYMRYGPSAAFGSLPQGIHRSHGSHTVIRRGTTGMHGAAISQSRVVIAIPVSAVRTLCKGTLADFGVP